MSRLVDLRLLRLIPLATLLFGARVFAQFEVAPDHFDSSAKNEGARPTLAKSKAGTALPVRARAVTQTAGATQAATIRHKPSTGRRTNPAARQLQSKDSAGVNRAAAKLQEAPRGGKD
jgi:hypothetical protein